jgi:hypothetical protein
MEGRIVALIRVRCNVHEWYKKTLSFAEKKPLFTAEKKTLFTTSISKMALSIALQLLVEGRR